MARPAGRSSRAEARDLVDNSASRPLDRPPVDARLAALRVVEPGCPRSPGTGTRLQSQGRRRVPGSGGHGQLIRSPGVSFSPQPAVRRPGSRAAGVVSPGLFPGRTITDAAGATILVRGRAARRFPRGLILWITLWLQALDGLRTRGRLRKLRVVALGYPLPAVLANGLAAQARGRFQGINDTVAGPITRGIPFLSWRSPPRLAITHRAARARAGLVANTNTA